jgi:hypothetical protein
MSPIKPVDARDPDHYIRQIDDAARRADIEALDRMIGELAPGLDRHLCYGMLGYGRLPHRYASGREGELPVIALASQKRYISLYVWATVAERYRERLPAVSIGKGCVRFRSLAAVDEHVLRELVAEAASADDPDGAFAQ